MFTTVRGNVVRRKAKLIANSMIVSLVLPSCDGRRRSKPEVFRGACSWLRPLWARTTWNEYYILS